ncbi:hypothetical protein FACS1894132_12960 [Clostridia bacterium]|nr:hypothetical protein FACS1894132_12960 [Clostridia bacterium]
MENIINYDKSLSENITSGIVNEVIDVLNNEISKLNDMSTFEATKYIFSSTFVNLIETPSYIRSYFYHLNLVDKLNAQFIDAELPFNVNIGRELNELLEKNSITENDIIQNFNGVVETLYLTFTPEMNKILNEGINISIEECTPFEEAD